MHHNEKYFFNFLMSIYYFIQSKKNFENIWSGIHLTAVQSQSRFQVTPRYRYYKHCYGVPQKGARLQKNK